MVTAASSMQMKETILSGFISIKFSIFTSVHRKGQRSGYGYAGRRSFQYCLIEQFRISRVCACLERPGRAVRQLIALCVDTRERHHNARETVEIVYRVFSVSSKFSRIRREQLGKGFLDNVRHITAFFQVYPEKVNKPDGNNKPRCYILFLWRFKILLTETPWKL